MTKKTFNKCILWTVFVLFSSFILTQRVAKYFVEERIAKEKQLVQHTAQTTALHFEAKIEHSNDMLGYSIIATRGMNG